MLVSGSKVFTLRWVGLGQSFGGLGCVEEIGPAYNSALDNPLTALYHRKEQSRTCNNDVNTRT